MHRLSVSWYRYALALFLGALFGSTFLAHYWVTTPDDAVLTSDWAVVSAKDEQIKALMREIELLRNSNHTSETSSSPQALSSSSSVSSFSAASSALSASSASASSALSSASSASALPSLRNNTNEVPLIPLKGRGNSPAAVFLGRIKQRYDQYMRNKTLAKNQTSAAADKNETAQNSSGWTLDQCRRKCGEHGPEGRMAGVLAAELKGLSSVLDMGYGRGEDLQLFRRAGILGTVGVEVNNMKKIVKDGGPLYLHYDIFSDTFDIDTNFDLVYSSNVIQFIAADKQHQMLDYMIEHTNKWLVVIERTEFLEYPEERPPIGQNQSWHQYILNKGLVANTFLSEAMYRAGKMYFMSDGRDTGLHDRPDDQENAHSHQQKIEQAQNSGKYVFDEEEVADDEDDEEDEDAKEEDEEKEDDVTSNQSRNSTETTKSGITWNSTVARNASVKAVWNKTPYYSGDVLSGYPENTRYRSHKPQARSDWKIGVYYKPAFHPFKQLRASKVKQECRPDRFNLTHFPRVDNVFLFNKPEIPYGGVGFSGTGRKITKETFSCRFKHSGLIVPAVRVHQYDRARKMILVCELPLEEFEWMMSEDFTKIEVQLSEIDSKGNEHSIPWIVPCDAQEEEQHYISACIQVQNQAEYIEEWVEYHIMMGIEHFYLYDNNATDTTKQIIQPYIDEGIITYTFQPNHEVQNAALQDCLYRFGSYNEWLYAFDPDEFFVPLQARTLVGTLSVYERPEFEDLASVGMTVQYFGTSGMAERIKDNLVVETYTWSGHERARDEKHRKSVSRPAKTFLFHVHWAQETSGPTFIMDPNVARMNHYFTKSEADLYSRMHRKWNASRKKTKKTGEWFAGAHDFRDTDIFRFLPELSERMNRNFTSIPTPPNPGF